jgi:glycogen debranching enzyme
MLWVDPSIARGVLLYLAATQATEIDVTRDAQPGKILHERRQCETARTGEVPFASYYGTVDATPLFVVLAGRYFARTRDEETIKRIWPNILAAMAWCDTYGDRDGDGFVEYFRETPNGLANQGWKDSFDSIFHRDGTLAEGPIALVEVQAYVYEARLQSATLAEHLGHDALAAAWRLKAAALMENLNSAFWSEELGSYAIALDGEKRPCLVHSSNAGHVLMTDMASTERAHRVANVLLSPQLFCGWGVRTVAEDAARYNPMSYHNGSVWPHDNALIGLGLARSGHKAHLIKIFEGLYSAQSYQADRRLPELFCGFQRRRGRAPVSYPVSCSPQAWASATPFGLLGASLGLEIDCAGKVVQFKDPVLPGFLDGVTLRKIRIGTASIDVRLLRRDGQIALDVLRRDGDVDAIVRK